MCLYLISARWAARWGQGPPYTCLHPHPDPGELEVGTADVPGGDRVHALFSEVTRAPSSLSLSVPVSLPSLWPRPPMLQAVHMNLIGFVYIFSLWKKYGIWESNLTFKFLQEKKIIIIRFQFLFKTELVIIGKRFSSLRHFESINWVFWSVNRKKKNFFLTFMGFFIELFKKIAGLLTKPILSPQSPPELSEFGNGWNTKHV